MNDKSFDFWVIHVHLQPSDPWEDGKTSLSSDDCKMKENCEGDEYAPSYLLVNPKSMQRRVILPMMIRDLLVHILNNNKKQVLIHYLNFRLKWKTSPHQLGMN